MSRTGLVGVLAAFCVVSSAASAHALLLHAVPAVGGSVSTPPAEIGLDFTEVLEPRFCTVTVQNAAGAKVDKGDLHGDGAHLAIGVGPLPPGLYTVTWHAISIDTHRTQGSFSFTVAP